MEFILSLIGNDLVREISGALLGVFVGGLGVWLWVKTGLSKLVQDGGKPAGNKLGLFINDIALKPIKDGNLKEQIRKDLKVAGNGFDDGWQLGIDGIKI